MSPAEQRQRSRELAYRVCAFADTLVRHGHPYALTDDLRLAAAHLSFASGCTRGAARRRRLKCAEMCLSIVRQRIA